MSGEASIFFPPPPLSHLSSGGKKFLEPFLCARLALDNNRQQKRIAAGETMPFPNAVLASLRRKGLRRLPELSELLDGLFVPVLHQFFSAGF